MLYIGAGVLAPSGYPTWTRMISRIVMSIEEEEPNAGWATLHDVLREKGPNDVSDILVSKLERPRLLSIMQKTIEADMDSKLVPQIFNSLKTIEFKGVISTDMTNIVERAFSDRTPFVCYPDETIDFPSILREKKFFILKPYGDFKKDRRVLFTEGEYRREVRKNPAYERFIGSLISSDTLFFIGASLDTIEEFLTSSVENGRSQNRHFALVAEEDWGKSLSWKQERLSSKYNLEIIPFSPTQGYPEVINFVNNLKNFVTEGPLSRKIFFEESIILKHIYFENIGPFRALKIEMSDEWSILLGDNGCGKSTLLRAIAVGLAGKDDRIEPVGVDLLRSGATKGLIELKVGNDVYRTNIIRDDNRVRIIPESITPVQGGRLLALGFPSIRGISIAELEGAKNYQSSSNPSVTDLLPLVYDSTDSRFDNLRQWILNISLLAKVKSNKSEINRKLLERFFKIMHNLTPGVKFRFREITNDPWDVMVDTDDGPVSINRISQGMSSIFCWVGTLLQRLYEVYPDSSDPAKENCLVLVDEIDAHLHPEWQSEIMGLIREEFPNLQVVASTHSPLIVANAKAGEVFRILRQEKGINVSRINESFEGWRADQILTAPPFGMSYARDSKTKKKLVRYKELLAKDRLSKAEETESEMLAEKLDQSIIRRYEKAETRQASKLVDEWVRGRLSEIPEEEKQRILIEATAYLSKLRGNSNA